MKQFLLNKPIEKPAQASLASIRMLAGKFRHKLFFCLMILTGILAITPDAKAAWHDYYFNTPWWDGSTGEVVITVQVIDKENVDEMFWYKRGGGTLTCNDIPIGTFTCWQDGNGRDIWNQNPMGGSFRWWADGDRTVLRWKIPQDLYYRNLNFHLTGTWYYDAPGSNDWANTYRQMNPSWTNGGSGLYHSIEAKELNLQPNGSLIINWRKTGYHDIDKKGGTTTLHHNYLGAVIESKTDREYGIFVYSFNKQAGESVTKEKQFSIQNIVNLGNLHFSSTVQYAYTGAPYPTNLRYTPNVYTQSVKLDWTENNMNSTANDGKWVIYRKQGGVATRLGEVSKGTRTYTDTKAVYNENVIYYVKWQRNSWPDIVSLDQTPELQTSVSVNMKRVYNIQLTAEPDKNEILLNWTVPNVPLANYDKNTFELYRVTDKENKKLITEIEVKEGINSYSYTDTDSEENDLKTSCSNHTYTIEVAALGTKDYGKFISDPLTTSITGNSIITSLKCAKGESDKLVKLTWKTDRVPKEPDNGETYVIYRRIADSNDDYREKHRFNSKEDYNSWEDADALPGIFYDYKVVCIVTCDENNKPQTDKTDIGFAQSTATVTGSIAYGTGTAVEGAQIVLQRSESDDYTNTQFNALLFGKGGYAILEEETGDEPDKIHQIATGDMTVQFYLKPDYTDADQPAILSLDAIQIGLKKATGTDKENCYHPTVTVNSGSEQVFNDIDIPCNRYWNVSIVKKGNNLTFCLVDDISNTIAVKSQTLNISALPSGSSTPAIQLGSLDEKGLHGLIDEFRLWSKALEPEDILNNYDRILTGNEKKLEIYWKFDEGLKERFFNYTLKDDMKNYYHGHLYSSVFTSSNIPLDNQLALKCFTNQQGNYQISGVPFSGTGTSYSIVPQKGVHEFNPKLEQRFINKDALVHNGIKFTDISSFPVSGKIFYKGTNIPVEGVMFSVDGNVLSYEGKPLISDANGEYQISVPIGTHYVTLSKEGHVFKNGGRYPAEANSQFDFQQPITGLNFEDITTVVIAGRVAGGELQNNLPLGLKAGKANIGQATLTLQVANADKYKLNDGTATWGPLDGASGESTLTVEANDDKVTITTDPATGEYTAVLPPIDFKVLEVKVKDISSESFKTGGAFFDLKPDVLTTTTDSLQTEEGTFETFTYNLRYNLIYRVPKATIQVTDDDHKKDNAFGESIYKYYAPGSTTPTDISLYTQDVSGKVTYTFGHPVFVQQEYYKFRIKAFEKYVNNDNSASPVIDIVPLQNKTVTIDNAIGRTRIAVSKENGEDIENTEKEQSAENLEGTLTLDENGEVVYNFLAGFPKVIGDYLLGISILVDNNGRMEQWEGLGDTPSQASPSSVTPNNEETSGEQEGQDDQAEDKSTFKGYVLGKLPKGTDFITKGPDLVTNIIRDPAGSNSYAYWEKGSSNTRFTLKNTNKINDSSVGAFVSMAPVFESEAGFGFAVITSVKAGFETETSAETKHTTIDRNNTYVTTSYKQRIETSSSPDYVGAMGDVYIGNSTNLLFGLADILDIRKDGDQYQISPETEQTTGINFSTTFNYSQAHIIGRLIPNLIELRNNLLVTVKPEEYENYPNSTDKPIYITKLDPTNSNFGTNNFDEVWGKDTTQSATNTKAPSYRIILPENGNFVDEIQDYNASIASWESAIAQNEEEKVKAFQTTKVAAMSNISFDAGTKVEKEYTKTNITNTSHYSHFYTATNFRFSEMGMFNEAGVQANIESHNENYTDTETGTEEQTDITYGFHLEDENSGDYFTIDTYDAGDSKSYIFYTKAGASSCPYEDAEYTQFYEPGEHQLAAKTVQVEMPILSVEPATVINVPSGGQATFELELGNLSGIGADLYYMLLLDKATNPDGAILKIDGVPLGDGQKFMIPAQGSIKKKLTLEQGSQDILSFENISILLASSCQCGLDDNWDDIADTIQVSAYFSPTCTNLTLDIPNKIMNASNTDEKLNVIIKDYDTKYTNFGSIQLQYRGMSESNWRIAHEFINNTTLRPLEKPTEQELIDGRAVIDYSFPMKGMSEGVYEFRVISLCKNGGEFAYNETEPILVTRDMSIPSVMGKPSPANGILTPGDEVSILFNKNIQTGKIIKDNITVKGVLNGYQVRDNVGLKFDGSGVAYTEAAINTGGSFSIEGWVKFDFSNPAQGTRKAGRLFQLGYGPDKVAMDFTPDNKIVVYVGNTSYYSDEITDTNWQYLALQYDAEAKTICVKRRSDKDGNNPVLSDKSLINATTHEVNVPATQGRFFLGNDNNSTNGLRGSVRQVNIWNRVRNESEITTDFNLSKSGNERSLISYWPLDEGTGKQATDKARARHLSLKTGWFIHPEGKAIEFSGNNSYLELESTRLPLLSADNYSIEFWFKGEKGQTNATLFSAGIGEVNETCKDNTFSIAFNENGKLSLRSLCNAEVISTADLLDNSWHHFALSLTRGTGNAIVYIDGVQSWQRVNTIIGTPMADKILIGARKFTTSENEEVTIGEFFIGSVDEIRIYNAALTSQHIKLNMNSKLEGKEVGLIAYYPFEKYTTGGYDQVSSEFTLDDMWTPTDGRQNGGTATATGTSVSSYAPPMKDVRPSENVSFNYTASDNKIIINVTESMQRIENCTLEFSVERVLDVNGNRMSPAVWTAYVNLNRLKWTSDEQVKLTQSVLESKTFKATISNSGATDEAFIIQDIPAWLTANIEQGVLKPQKNQEIIFTVDPATAIGSYEATLLLSGKDNVNEPLTVNLTVLGEKPDWSVNPADYSGSMNLIGQVLIEGLYQEDSEDIIGAFIGDECVGVGSPSYSTAQNSYYLYLDIYGNDIHKGKEVNFRLWDAGTGRIYPNLSVTNPADAENKTVLFYNQSVIGSIEQPVKLNAFDRIERSINLAKGWNWISVNVENVAGEADNLSQFKTNIGTNGIILKGQIPFIQYTQNNWRGNLTDITTHDMYMLQTSNAHKLNFVGKPVSPSAKSITLKTGWNWIGYTPQFVSNIKDALAGIPNATKGDIIKAQSGFATFDGSSWRGSLNYITPGLGYMYYSKASESQIFTYPSQSGSQKSMLRSASAIDEPKWNADVNKFASNMTLIGSVLENGEEVTGNQYELGVFQGDECRGNIRLSYNPDQDRYLAYLTIHGDENEQMNFRLYNHETGTVSESVTPVSISYKADTQHGTLDMPYKITFSTATSIDEILEGDYGIHPTVNVESYIWFDYQPELIEKLEIIHGNGAVLMHVEQVTDNYVNVSNIPTGICYLRITYKGKVHIHKFIKK